MTNKERARKLTNEWHRRLQLLAAYTVEDIQDILDDACKDLKQERNALRAALILTSALTGDRECSLCHYTLFKDGSPEIHKDGCLLSRILP